jgi:hypothetical protein
MATHFARLIATLALPLILCSLTFADIRDDYELTVSAAVKATKGWQLYEDEKFAGSFDKGHYTDVDRKTKVKDFWSDGRIAKLDRDDNGHFETIFVVVDNELVYAGSIGRMGNFIHVAGEYAKHLGQPDTSLRNEIERAHDR